jgi:hypothetical protein
MGTFFLELTPIGRNFAWNAVSIIGVRAKISATC